MASSTLASYPASVVRAKVQGVVATAIQRDDRQIDIRLRSEERFRDSVEDLRRLTVHQIGKTASDGAGEAAAKASETPTLWDYDGVRILGKLQVAGVTTDIKCPKGRSSPVDKLIDGAAKTSMVSR